MEFKDYYKLLGVTKRSTPAEIKKAFRKLARKYHPDVNPGDQSAETRFKGINEAYEVLGDSDKRNKYDELGANWRQYDQAQAASGSPGGNVRWSANVGRAPGGGSRSMSQEEVQDLFGDNPFSDFFQTFFAGGSTGNRRRGRTSSGRDVEYVLELTLERAYHGTTQKLSLETGGHTHSVEVRIPAGVSDGSRVRVAGEGEPGSGGAASGDLLLRIRVMPHPVFELKGRDLHVKTSVPVTTAILGGDVEVPTPDGKSVRLKVPAATQPGQVFRLKGKGLPSVGHRTRHGDLYSTVHVTLPKRLSAKAREHYEALAALEAKSKNKEKRTVA